MGDAGIGFSQLVHRKLTLREIEQRQIVIHGYHEQRSRFIPGIAIGTERYVSGHLSLLLKDGKCELFQHDSAGMQNQCVCFVGRYICLRRKHNGQILKHQNALLTYFRKGCLARTAECEQATNKGK